MPRNIRTGREIAAGYDPQHPSRYTPVLPHWDTGKPLAPTTITTARLTDEDLATLDELLEWMQETEILGRHGRYTRSAAIKQLIAWWRMDRAHA